MHFNLTTRVLHVNCTELHQGILMKKLIAEQVCRKRESRN